MLPYIEIFLSFSQCPTFYVFNNMQFHCLISLAIRLSVIRASKECSA
jgi:hypothetical protein